MKKQVLLVSLTLAVLFGGVAVWKGSDTSEEAGAQRTKERHGERRVRQFWTFYREATDRRMEGALQEAVEAYDRALALHPEHEDALYYKGNVLLRLGQYAQAESAYATLTRVNPSSARGYAQLGEVSFCYGREAGRLDLEAAAASFRRARAINKEETGPLLRLGQIALVQGDLTLAGEHFDAVLRTHVDNVPTHVLKGYVAWVQGRRDEAVRHLERALQHADPSSTTSVGSSEGDTKGRAAFLLARASSCPTMDEALPDLAEVATTARAAVDAWYATMQQAIADLRRDVHP